MARGLQIRRSQIENIAHLYLHGFRVKFEAIEPVGDMPTEVFVFRRHPADPDTGNTFDEFMTVASFVDISEYPVGAPDAENGLPFFRKSDVELDFRALAHVEEAWNAIRVEVCNLVNALDNADTLVPSVTVQCGEPPTVSDSSQSVSL